MSRTYTPSNISAISTHLSEATQVLSPSQRLAAARATIRHRLHSDQSDLASQSPNGLHPMYFMLHGRGDGDDVEIEERQQVLAETLADVFDAVSQYISQVPKQLTFCPSSLP